MYAKVKCEVCGRMLSSVTAGHLKTHSMTVQEYRQQYPDAPLMGEYSPKIWTGDNEIVEETIADIEKAPLIAKTEAAANPVIEELKMLPVITKIADKKVEPLQNQDGPDENVDKSASSLSQFVRPGERIHPEKLNILKFLARGYEHVENNYSIEKWSLTKFLEYKLITDIAIPDKKIDLEFPNTYWHNQDYVKSHRDMTLINDGWNVVTFESENPTVAEVKHTLKKLGLI